MAIDVLVVENNPVILQAVTTYLEKEECHVKTATNGLEALETLQNYHPDIVFTDLIMPLVGGEQLCQSIRQTPEIADLFIVVMSAIILESKETVLAEIDFDVCIIKGNLKELREAIHKALELFAQRNREDGGRRPMQMVIGNTQGKSSIVAEELLSETRHLEKIVENIDDAIVELSKFGKIVSVNRTALSVFERSKEELIGLSLEQLPWGSYNKEIVAWMQNELIGGGAANLMVQEDPLLYEDKFLTARFLPVRDKESDFAICIFRDITRQFKAERYKHELEQGIRLAKKMEAMSSMAGGVAHDFNNLLTVICGNLDMILLNEEATAPVNNTVLVEETKKAAYVIVDLVRKISCFSPFGIIIRNDVFFQDVLRQALTKHYGLSAGKYILHCPKDKTIVNIDSEQIETAITNILINASESGAEDPVEISVSREELATPLLIESQYVPAGSYLKASFRDTGRGIEKENLHEIFDPYYSTKSRGTVKGMGLGLTVVYATLRNHGGYVVVESTPGEGTTVSLYLPYFTQIPSATPADSTADAASLNKNILLLEEEQARTVGKIMLSHLGYDVTTVTNKEDAIETVRKDFEAGKRYLLAIIHLGGFDGRDGVETNRRLKEIDPDILMVASSGSLLMAPMENCQRFGFINTLPKPYTLDDLKHVINSSR